jgi:hypothetical protein
MEKGDFVTPARKDHRLHRQMQKAWRFLAEQGEAGKNAFAGLLTDESVHVRTWVAAQLLSEGNERAVRVLEKIAQEDSSGLTGFAAETTLKEWKRGRLSPPFGSAGA